MEVEALERLADAGSRAAAVERKRMLVIVNPYASAVCDRLRGLVLAALASRYEVEALDTQARGQATELCREAAHEGYDVVVAFGGDGTVNEAANGLVGSPTLLTPLPGGATNVLAKLLGIPSDVVDATQHLLGLADAWRTRRIDLGRVNGRWFTFSAGVGLPASVVRRVDAHPRHKARLRQWYFTWAAVEVLAREYLVHPPRLVVEVDGRTLRGVTLVVQNGHTLSYFYDRPLRVAEGAALDGGTLAGAVLRRATPLAVPTVALRLFSGARVVGHRQVDGFEGARELRCTSADGRPLPLEVDGDALGDVTEAAYGIAPGALSVLA